MHQVQVDAGHNYNLESREAVYAWFGKWLLDEEESTKFREVPFEVEADEDLLVFHGRELPTSALSEEEISRSWIESAERQLEERKPTNKAELERFREEMGAVLLRSLAIHVPGPSDLKVEELGEVSRPDFTAYRMIIGQKGVGDQLPAILFTPKSAQGKGPATLIVHPQGKVHLLDQETGKPTPLVTRLLAAGHSVLTVDVFLTGECHTAEHKAQRDESIHYFTTYNRTDAALRVQDILTALAYLNRQGDVSEINVVGLEGAGLWCLLAAGFANVACTVIDADQFDSDSDEAYLQTLPIPVIRRAGDFRTSVTLVVPRHLMIHNTGDVFETEWITDVYNAVGASDRLRVERDMVPEAEIAAWLAH